MSGPPAASARRRGPSATVVAHVGRARGVERALGFDGVAIHVYGGWHGFVRRVLHDLDPPPERPRGRIDLVIRHARRLPVLEARARALFFHGAAQVWRVPGAGHEIRTAGSRLHLPHPGRIEVTATGGFEDEDTTALFVGFSLALRATGRYHVHAALVRSPAGTTAMLVGPSGCGKSTTAALLALGDFAIGSEDACFVRGTVPRVRGWPRPLRLDATHVGRFPELARGVLGCAPGDRSRLEVRPPRGLLRESLRPDVVLVLERGPRPTRLVPLGGAEALGALLEASATVVVDGLPGRLRHLRTLESLASRTTAFRLCLGPEILNDPRAFAGWMTDRLARATDSDERAAGPRQRDTR